MSEIVKIVYYQIYELLCDEFSLGIPSRIILPRDFTDVENLLGPSAIHYGDKMMWEYNSTGRWAVWAGTIFCRTESDAVLLKLLLG